GSAEQLGQTGVGLVDITSGANCIASAGPGWDDVTGWGSPRGLDLVHDLSSSFVDVALTTASGSVVPGGSVGASVTVQNATDHAALAAVSVVFTLQASGTYAGPCGGTFSTVTSPTDGNGTATASLSVPGCYLGSSAVLTVVASSKGYYGSNTTTIAVNLLGVAGFLAVAQVFPYNVVLFAGIVGAAVGIAYLLGERGRRRSARIGGTRVRRPPGPGTRAPPRASSPRVAPAVVAINPPPPAPPTTPSPPAAGPPAASADVAGGQPLRPGAVPVEPVLALPTVPDHVADPPGAAPPPLARPGAATGSTPPAPGGEIPSHVFSPPENRALPPMGPASLACTSCGGPLEALGPPCPSCGAASG
ncbi:MAG: hypothetical protein L3K17_03635, partial [Thermoplasmata archaeon]|nr:hypothetical protein [Thermoplasmata archaeon]